MNMSLRFLIFVALAVPLYSFAATTDWDAFDFNTCKHWKITNDFGGSGDAFDKAQNLSREQNQSGSAEHWFVIEAGKLYEEGKPEYGVCRFEPRSITCHPGTVFPIAGATFEEKRKMTFQCTRGCDHLPFRAFYQAPYEDGPASEEWGSAARKFEAVCHEEKKYREFFKRLNKRAPR